MIIACPKCKARHDISGRAPGDTFSCSCGNVLAAPKKGGPVWIIVLVVILCCSVPCIGILAAIAIPNFIKYQLRAKQGEARVNIVGIRTAEIAYFQAHDGFVPAGPVPATIPGKMPADFSPDEGFKSLGWSPDGKVRYQYRVVVEGKEAIITARGDLDEDGKPAEFRVKLDADGHAGPVEDLTPNEY
jgi:type IV pilus assembly protein PilA